MGLEFKLILIRLVALSAIMLVVPFLGLFGAISGVLNDLERELRVVSLWNAG